MKTQLKGKLRQYEGKFNWMQYVKALSLPKKDEKKLKDYLKKHSDGIESPDDVFAAMTDVGIKFTESLMSEANDAYAINGLKTGLEHFEISMEMLKSIQNELASKDGRIRKIVSSMSSISKDLAKLSKGIMKEEVILEGLNEGKPFKDGHKKLTEVLFEIDDILRQISDDVLSENEKSFFSKTQSQLTVILDKWFKIGKKDKRFRITSGR